MHNSRRTFSLLSILLAMVVWGGHGVHGSSVNGGPVFNTPITGTLTSAQLKTMRSQCGMAACYQVMPQPGSNQTIIIDSFQVNMIFGTTPYSGTIQLFLGWTRGATTAATAACPSSVFTQSMNYFCLVGQPTGGVAQESAALINQPITIGITGASDLTLGDGSMNYQINYHVLTGIQ